MPAIERLVACLPRLEAPIAVVFRHYQLPAVQRLVLADQVRRQVQARGHLFLMARASFPGVDGTHAHLRGSGLRSAPVHSYGEGVRAAERGADLAFVSPVLATESHPGASCLGAARAAQMAAQIPLPAFALGGMDERSVRRLRGSSFQGFGAIGAFLERP